MQDLSANLTTCGLHIDVERRLISDLAEVFPSIRSSSVLCLSVDPPAWIEVCATIGAWKLLSPFAKEFLKQWTKRAKKPA
jgi:hypothetical protein